MRHLIVPALALLLLSATGCGDPFQDDPREVCRDNCADLGFFDCASDERIAECGRQCNLRSEAVVADFNTCKSGGICNSANCLNVLIPGSSSNETTNNANQAANNSTLIMECKSTCDSVGTCLEVDRAGTVIDCKAACEGASTDAIESFESCERSGFGCEEDVVCFDFLSVPYTYP